MLDNQFWDALGRLYDESLVLKEATASLASATRHLHDIAVTHESRLDKLEVQQWLAEKERAREKEQGSSDR